MGTNETGNEEIQMTPLRRELVDMALDPEKAFSLPPDELYPKQLAAAQELFEVRVKQIPLLRKRAEDAGIDRIRSFDDLVPLLFAHTVYKSYPPHFVEQGRWGDMLKWLQTLSVPDLSNVNVEGVRDVDEWLDRLWAAGHAVLSTSGSGGKVSFLTYTMQDRRLKTRYVRHTQTWPFTKVTKGRPVFWLGPMVGRNSAVEMGISIDEIWSGPEGTHALTDHPLLIAEVSRSAAMRKKIASGTATPQEIQDFESSQAVKAAAADEELMRLINKILDHRHQPMFLFGLWAQHMAIVRRARELGIGDGEFHPETVLFAAGGIKGLALPADYREQVERFYGDVISIAIYGLTEMSQIMQRCDAGRYHVPPGLILLLLDATGEKLLGPKPGVTGLVEGRVGFVDLLHEGRWSGLISGDKATVDYSGTCPCGRPGHTMLDTVVRYTQIGAEDHIGCAGTIDAYVRGGLPA